jgi:hypothetical protein
MMQMIARVLVGVLGLAGVLIALRIWMAPADVAAQLGVGPLSSLGLATIRADMAGFFGAAGAFALFAAIRNRGAFLLAPLVLVGIALTGRVLTVALNGYSEDMAPPMAIEVVLLVVLGFGRMKLAR